MISEANSESLLPLVKEYESMIETLTTQVEFYANEQENLRKEINNLIKDNKALGETVNELIEFQSQIAKENEKKDINNELVENLKKQLNLTLKEKDTVVELWQNALKNIDHLEEELQLFEGRTHGYFSKKEVIKIKQRYENQANELEEQLHNYQLKLKTVTKELEQNLQNKNADLKKALEIQENTTTLVKKLENEVKHLQEKLKEILTMRDELQKKLDTKNDLIEELKTKDFEAKAKVTEAIQIVEAAFYEKDAALLREKEAKDEVVKISKALSEVMDEASIKIKKEIEDIKEDCNVKMKKLQQNMQTLKIELNAKNVELEKYLRECKLLEEELGRIRKGNISIDESNTSKLLILEKNLETTFQKLLLSEKKNVQIMAEKENLKSDLEQMANYYERDIKSKEIEKEIFKSKIERLQKQLKTSNKSLIQVAEEMNKMNTKIKLLDEDIQNKLEAKDTMYEETLAKTLAEVQNKNIKVQSEIQKYLEIQIVLNKKYRNEVRDVINKLEYRMKDLKKINKSLRKKLEKAVDESFYYKQNLSDICTNVKNLASVSHNNKDPT